MMYKLSQGLSAILEPYLVRQGTLLLWCTRSCNNVESNYLILTNFRAVFPAVIWNCKWDITSDSIV